LEGFAVAVEDGVVGGLDPKLAAVPAAAQVAAGVELAAPELLPEGAVLGALPVPGVDEHRMMLAAQLLEGVAECAAEVLVGREDPALEVELDDGLRAVQRLEHAGVQPRLGDIGPFQR